MRVAFTILAVLLVAVLCAALAAPYFIDWTGQRAQIEAHLSKVLGSRVTIAGPIDLKLLPVPYIALAKVRVAEGDRSAASLDIESARLEMALTALVRGQFRFTQASFDHPVLTIARGQDGSLGLPHFGARASSEQIALDNIVVRDGRLDVAAAGDAPPIHLTGIDLDAAADSLRGPFNGAGAADGPAGSRLSFHFATGTAGANDLPVKSSFDTASPVHGEFDGAVTFVRSGADALTLSYAGATLLSGAIAIGEDGAWPWRASAAARADAQGVDLSNLELRLGEDERALIATGSANARFGAGAGLTINLASKKLDLDAMLRRQGESSAPPARALEMVRRLVAGAGGGDRSPFKVSFDLASPSAILGGAAVNDIALHASAAPDAPITGRLECSPPGGSHLIASGSVELGSAASFKGRIDAETSDAQPLRDWLTQDAESMRASLAALGDVLPYRSIGLGGDFDISNAGFAARNLRLTVEQTSLSGTLAWTSAMGSERSRLFADLRSDELDLASLPNVSAGDSYFRDSDLALTLEARALHVEHVGGTNLSGGLLSLKLSKTGQDIALDRLSIAGLGGANIDATGGANARGSWLDGRLEASQLGDFAALVKRLAPGAASDALRDRAPLLSPAKLTFQAQFAAGMEESGFAPVSLTLAGAAAATHVNAKIAHGAADANSLEATLSLDSPDAAPLLRQLGAPVQALAGKGPGHFAVTGHGRMAEGFETEAKATLAGVDISWRGHFQLAGNDDAHPLLAGAAGLKAADASSLLSIIGFAAPDFSLTIPAILDADVVWRGNSFSLTHLKGNVGAARLSGDLSWAAPASEAAPSILDPDVALANAIAGDQASERAAQIEGQLTIDRLSASALTGLAFGADGGKSGARWSDAAFAHGLAKTPSADIKLAISRLDLNEKLQAQEARGRLKIDPGVVKLSDWSMNLRGGGLSGHVDLRRNGASAAVSGEVGIASMPVDASGIAGSLSLSLDFAGSGQSARGLIGNLAGQGEVKLNGVKAPRLDPGALGRIVDKAEAPDYPIDQTNVEHALAIELDKQPLSLPDASAPAFLSNGMLRVSPVEVVASPKSRASLTASVDFKSLTGELHAAFSQLQTAKFWSGPPPAIEVIVKGPFDAPNRSIDAASFAAGLAQQAIARESDRIATLEADMRERAAFNRRLKAEDFMLKREQELAAYARDQARLKSEQDRRRVEESLLSAAEAAKKAIEDAKKAEEARKAEDEAKRVEELKAAEAAKKAADAKQNAPDASAVIAPPLPDEVMPPLINVPSPPPRPKLPSARPADPTASGLY